MHTKHYTNKGSSLLEVMIAVFVLAVGLLGIAGLQVTAVKNNHTASLRSQSTQLAYDLADRMRANMPATISGNYISTAAPAATYNCFDDFTGTATSGVCAPSEMALADLDWVFSLATNTLPFVSAAISCTPSGGTAVAADTGASDCPQGSIQTITITSNEQDGTNGLVNKSMTIEFQP